MNEPGGNRGLVAVRALTQERSAAAGDRCAALFDGDILSILSFGAMDVQVVQAGPLAALGAGAALE